MNVTNEMMKIHYRFSNFPLPYGEAAKYCAILGGNEDGYLANIVSEDILSELQSHFIGVPFNQTYDQFKVYYCLTA